MGKYKVEWIGKDELGDILNKALSQSEEQVHKVVYNTAEKGKGKAIEFSPKPGGSRYGNNPYSEGPLHDNIVTHYPGRLHAEIEAKVGHAGFVNFGTRKMRKQPFMTDAFEEFIKPEFKERIYEVAKGLFK